MLVPLKIDEQSVMTFLGFGVNIVLMLQLLLGFVANIMSYARYVH
jgi:hypothetical protein